MANEAASVAADEAPPTTTDPSLPDPPQLTKSDPAQKAIKEPAKPQTPIASVDASKGILLYQHFKMKMILINFGIFSSSAGTLVGVHIIPLPLLY